MKILDPLQEEVVAEEGAVRGGISGWLALGVGVREEIGATPNLSPIPLLIHSPFNFSSKFRKSQKMPLNIPTKEK